MQNYLGHKIIAMSKFFLYMAWLQCLFVASASVQVKRSPLLRLSKMLGASESFQTDCGQLHLIPCGAALSDLVGWLAPLVHTNDDWASDATAICLHVFFVAPQLVLWNCTRRLGDFESFP